MLSNNIKQLRKKYNVKQEDLCNYFNVARGTVSMWETGKREPDIATLKNLAKFFNVTVDYLIGNDTENKIAEVKLQPTAQQKKCISEINTLSDIECIQVLTYIKTMQQVKLDADALRILKLSDDE